MALPIVENLSRLKENGGLCVCVCGLGWLCVAWLPHFPLPPSSPLLPRGLAWLPPKLKYLGKRHLNAPGLGRGLVLAPRGYAVGVVEVLRRQFLGLLSV